MQEISLFPVTRTHCFFYGLKSHIALYIPLIFVIFVHTNINIDKFEKSRLNPGGRKNHRKGYI